MGGIFIGLGALFGLGAFVCWVMVVIKMFQNDKSTLGIITIVLIFCGGIGYLIGLVVGWMNSTAWKIKNLMLAYTACLIFAGALYGVGIAFTVGEAIQNMPDVDMQQFDMDMDEGFDEEVEDAP